MGKDNNAILSYLSDKARFADMINAEVYKGHQIIKPDRLTEVSSTTYTDITTTDDKKTQKRQERRSDLAMEYEDGSIYRLFLIEAQDKVSYVYPLRCMRYLLSQYLKQISSLASEHDRKRDYNNYAEKFSKMSKTDRLKPEYIICLYHGEEPWDGPRSLRDMMDFGDDSDGFSDFFQDFNPHLICINEMTNTSNYKTELKQILDLLIVRYDFKTLAKVVEEDPAYNSLDDNSLETAAILLNVPSLWKRRKKYSEEGGFNMCKAFRDYENNMKSIDAQLKEKKAQLKEKKAQIKEQKDQLKEQKDQLKEQATLIEELQRQLAAAQAQLVAANHS